MVEPGHIHAPLRTLSWGQKEAKGRDWYKQNINYEISRSRLNTTMGTDDRSVPLLYDIYNNKFPLDWFKHVTDPLSAKVQAHKSFPAKIRPVSMLRTNIDLLMSEYPRRPFLSTVTNLGEGGFNKYTEELRNKIQGSITEYFEAMFQASMSPEEAAANAEDPQPAPIPEEIKKKFHETYKDSEAIKGQKWLNRAIREYNIKQKLLRMFKDWLIAGTVVSYKGISHGTYEYERISPLMFDCEISENATFFEDASSVRVKRMMTTAEVVDRFYEELGKGDIVKLEKGNIRQTPEAFYDYLTTSRSEDGLHTVWHVLWKARKEVLILSRTNPETGEPEEMQVDEDYPVGEGESIESIWPNEIYEGWRIDDDLFLGMGPLDVQRNEMNNFSACKMPYNGRNYSDTHSQNISPLEIGIPYQIMYIIVTRTLELTIAKSKGKILLIDQAAIPNEGDWDEEKFFYYAEAMGYGLLNRNQIGVDKSFNQYQVMDMSLFDSIKQLIDLQDHFKQQWDDVLGINRQRKGQTYASDAVGVTERATFQSTVITDMIFNLFEEFVESELQGTLDYSKFVNIEGIKSLWNNDLYETELLEIDPNTYCSAELGVFFESGSEAIALKNKIDGTVNNMIQNNARPSTVVEVLRSVNTADLFAKLKDIERIEDEVAAQQQQSEAKAQEDADARREKYMKLENLLKTEFMNAEYDRKEEIELIRAESNTLTFQDGDSNDNGVADIKEIEKHKLEREKLQAGTDKSNADRAERQQTNSVKAAQKNRELDLKEKALNKPKPTSK